MAVPRRRIRESGTYFVTSRTWQGRRIFINAAVCEIFRTALLRYRDEGHYLLHAFVLMPEHFHLLITPAEDVALEHTVQFIKGGSAHRIREERKLMFPVWQRGFSDHRIRDYGDYETHFRYIEQNPVKRRIVTAASEYEWSSAGWIIALDGIPQRLKPLSSAAARHG